MLIYELYKDDICKNKGIKNTIAAGEYILRNDDFIKHAFNFGNGAVVEHIKQGRIDTTDTVHICKGTKGGLDRYVKIRAEDKEYLQRVFSVEKPIC